MTSTSRHGPAWALPCGLLGDDVQALHDALADAGVKILQPPTAGPFGLTFTFADPDGYAVTVHDKH
ncbi:VOC family protein [Propionibacterium freudenreichii]|uniref:VOC family protein n=1 Tax=Propionibacterium freudenreichii TaxID=1744 RepID=UPI00254BFBF8|nr:VOC family protein [Propionibacterium freudenreichii]